MTITEFNGFNRAQSRFVSVLRFHLHSEACVKLYKQTIQSAHNLQDSHDTHTHEEKLNVGQIFRSTILSFCFV